MSNTADWGLCEPFGIDNGELDGLRPQEVFVLGVEWQMVYESMELSHEFRRLIHAENEQRICDLLRRHGRQFQCVCRHDDWRDLRVAAK